MTLLEASPLWAGKFTGADSREERPGKGQGGEGFILHQAEGEEEAEQLVSYVHYRSGNELTVHSAIGHSPQSHHCISQHQQGTSVKSWTIKGSPIGIDFLNTRDAMHQLEKGINNIGVKGRDIRPYVHGYKCKRLETVLTSIYTVEWCSRE